MRLVEAGRLDLDVDIDRYLTSWRVPANDGWAPRITLRQLLSHTAGTTVHGFPGYPAQGVRPTVPQILDGEPPANTEPVVVDLLPGTQFRYSGGGTTIAQQAVADVMNLPFADLMRELVLDPLGMADSTFELPLPAALAARAATAHPWNGVQTRGGWHVYPEMAAAGLWTTAGDLARLGTELMRTLRGDWSPLGLKQETVAAMLRPQLPDQAIGQDFVGLGWFCAGKDDKFRFGHQGANEGYLAEIRLFPAHGRGAVMMNNSIQGWRLRGEIIKAVGREYGWPDPDAITCSGDDACATWIVPASTAIRTAWRWRSLETARACFFNLAGRRRSRSNPASTESFSRRRSILRVRFENVDAGSPVAMTDRVERQDDRPDPRRPLS